MSSLVPLAVRPYGSDMTSERRAKAVRKALELVPGSILAVATETGVSEKLLRMIRDGNRSATPATVEALASALERFASRNAEAARVLRETLGREEP